MRQHGCVELQAAPCLCSRWLPNHHWSCSLIYNLTGIEFILLGVDDKEGKAEGVGAGVVVGWWGAPSLIFNTLSRSSQVFDNLSFSADSSLHTQAAAFARIETELSLRLHTWSHDQAEEQMIWNFSDVLDSRGALAFDFWVLLGYGISRLYIYYILLVPAKS